MPHEHSSEHFSSPLWLTHKQTLPREPQPTSHATRTFLITLLFTSLAHAQTNIASRTSTNITCHTNIPHQHFSSPLWLTHKQTLPREPQPTSHATRTFTKKLLFTSLAHAQTNIASRTSTNITCHTNIHQEHFSSPLWLTHKQTLPREPQPTSHVTRTFLRNTSLHLFGSRTNKHCLANLNQHHMPHEHSLSNFSSPLWLTHKQTLPCEPQPTSHATRTFLRNTSLHLFGSRTNKHCLANLNQHHMPHEHSLMNTSLHLFGSRTNKHCLANLNQHHMPHEPS